MESSSETMNESKSPQTTYDLHKDKMAVCISKMNPCELVKRCKPFNGMNQNENKQTGVKRI